MLTFLLSACGGSVQTCSDQRAVVVPEDLKHCPGAPSAVHVPDPPRTFETVVAWANATEKQREMTAASLKECSARLDRLLALVGSK